MGTAALVILAIVVVGVLMVIAKYNQLVGLRNRIENAWSQIDVQLRRRYDLIPNLVETVKGYAAHEKEVFEKVSEARSAMMSAQGAQAQGEAQNQITQALKSLFAVAEAYPQLRANENFMRTKQQAEILQSQFDEAKMELDRLRGQFVRSQAEAKDVRNQLNSARQNLDSIRQYNAEAAQRLNEQIEKLTELTDEVSKGR